MIDSVILENKGGPLQTVAAKHIALANRTQHYAAITVVCATFFFLGLRIFRLISRYAVNIFFYDQWDFDNATLFEGHSLWQIFRWQHGPHRQGLGGVLSKILEPFIRWNSRSEAFAIGAIIIIAGICAVYLKKRMYGSIGYSDILIPVIFLTPSQFETWVINTNPSHGALPVLLTILYCVAWTVPGVVARYAWIIIINFLLIYTGFGIFIGVITPPLIAIDYFRRDRILRTAYRAASISAFVLSVASILSFFVSYKWQPAVDCFSPQPQNPIKYIAFVGFMFANLAGVKGIASDARLVGGTLLVGIIAALGVSLKRILSAGEDFRPNNAVIAILLSFCLLFCLNTAIGRLCLGLEAAQASRYVPYLVLGFLGLYFSVLSLREQAVRLLLVAALLLLAISSSYRMNWLDWEKMRTYSHGKKAWRECYLKNHDIEQCNVQTQFQIYPWPEGTRLQQKLHYLEQKKLNLFADSR